MAVNQQEAEKTERKLRPLYGEYSRYGVVGLTDYASIVAVCLLAQML